MSTERPGGSRGPPGRRRLKSPTPTIPLAVRATSSIRHHPASDRKPAKPPIQGHAAGTLPGRSSWESARSPALIAGEQRPGPLPTRYTVLVYPLVESPSGKLVWCQLWRFRHGYTPRRAGFGEPVHLPLGGLCPGRTTRTKTCRQAGKSGDPANGPEAGRRKWAAAGTTWPATWRNRGRSGERTSGGARCG